jgi:hypothetical protein
MRGEIDGDLTRTLDASISFFPAGVVRPSLPVLEHGIIIGGELF